MAGSNGRIYSLHSLIGRKLDSIMPSEPVHPNSDEPNFSADDSDSLELPYSDEDAIAGLSNRQRQDLTRFVAAGMEMSVISGNPLVSKINERHLADMISLASKELEYDYNDRHRNRIFWGILGVFAMILLVGFAAFLAFQNMSNLLSQLLRDGLLFLSGLAAGLGGGYGLAKRRR